MDYQAELAREREYTARVQQLLYAIIEQSKEFADLHNETIRAMLADAWEELRMKPTALSQQDLEQLSTEVNHYLARKVFSDDVAQRYERMLLTPFFARVDFHEQGTKENERIVIGLYSLKNEQGDLLVHDWRAPVCSLYYDSMPGEVSYEAPEGVIRGQMTLKRQYRMEEGRLKYFVDTDVSIDDDLLLDILSRATSSHMRNIVSTIQHEQNMAIRHEKARVLSVVGGAGSGKTSVAMHRAAYLMYRQRNFIDASHIAVLSPSGAFSEYISTVLPDLGEESTRTITLRRVVKDILKFEVETPCAQVEHLLVSSNPLRAQSVYFKAAGDFHRMLSNFIGRYKAVGPRFETVALGNHILAEKDELEHMYRTEFSLLTPALRLIRIQTVLESRLSMWEKSLSSQYESRLIKSYRGKDLELATRMAVSQHLQPIKAQIRALTQPDVLHLYSEALQAAPEALAAAARENEQARLVWWEDASALCYLMLEMGFAAPDKSVRHLLIDEAQDYSEVALHMLHLYYPMAHITLLGDPNQRTCPHMPECDPAVWGGCFGTKDAPLIRLSRCYRSTQPITRLCNALLPENARLREFGREGEWPAVEVYSFDRLKETIAHWQQKGLRTIAIITRTQEEAVRLAKKLPNAWLFSDVENEMMPEAGGVMLASYHLMKGLEFDAVAAVWPDVPLTDDERRRLYTACSRALHGLCLLGGSRLIAELGIIL